MKMNIETIISFVVAVLGAGGVGALLKNHGDNRANKRDDDRDDFIVIKASLYEEIQRQKDQINSIEEKYNTILENYQTALKDKHQTEIELAKEKQINKEYATRIENLEKEVAKLKGEIT